MAQAEAGTRIEAAMASVARRRETDMGMRPLKRRSLPLRSPALPIGFSLMRRAPAAFRRARFGAVIAHDSHGFLDEFEVGRACAKPTLGLCDRLAPGLERLRGAPRGGRRARARARAGH